MSVPPIAVNLSLAQINKLRSGKSVQLKIQDISPDMDFSPLKVMLHPANYKKVASSVKKGKGVRLEMTPDELLASDHVSGGAFNFGSIARALAPAVVNLAGELTGKQKIAKSVNQLAHSTGAYGYQQQQMQHGGAFNFGSIARALAPIAVNVAGELTGKQKIAKSVNQLAHSTGAYGYQPVSRKRVAAPAQEPVSQARLSNLAKARAAKLAKASSANRPKKQAGGMIKPNFQYGGSFMLQ